VVGRCCRAKVGIRDDRSIDRDAGESSNQESQSVAHGCEDDQRRETFDPSSSTAAGVHENRRPERLRFLHGCVVGRHLHLVDQVAFKLTHIGGPSA